MKHILYLIAIVIVAAYAAAQDDPFNTSVDLNTSIVNNDTRENTNATVIISPIQVTDFTLASFSPREVNMGDVQLNIQVQNTGTTELRNVIAFVAAKDFSTYDITPIDLLRPGEKSYVLVSGNFKRSGPLTLTIRINDKTFLQNIVVLDPNAEENAQKLKDIGEQEAKRRQLLDEVSASFTELQSNYTMLEKDLQAKKEGKYNVAEVNLADLKTFLRNTQSSLVIGDADQAKASYTLALSEYNDQKARLDAAQPIKRSIMNVLQDNALVISTIAGAIIAIFTLFEVVKSKKDALYKKIKEVKVDKDTKIVVKQKKGKKE